MGQFAGAAKFTIKIASNHQGYQVGNSEIYSSYIYSSQNLFLFTF
jgi:hypothetical protein